MMKIKIFFLILIFAALAGCSTVKTSEVRLTADDNFRYEPSSITVTKGQPVTLLIKNKGSLEHDFVIQKISAEVTENHGDMSINHNMADMDYDLHLASQPGKSNSITFTPLETGTYEFFCAVKGHKESGMTGTLIVTQ